MTCLPCIVPLHSTRKRIRARIVAGVVVTGVFVPLLPPPWVCHVDGLARAEDPTPAADQPSFSGFSATKAAAETAAPPAAPAEDRAAGWLGLAVDDSLVPGRLVVVEVDPRGPAARSGIRLQDMVLAIDGEPTLDAERFAAAVSAIAVGDKPRLSIGRGGTVEDVTLVATDPPRRPETDSPAGGNAAGGVAGSGRNSGVDAENGSIAIEEPSAFGRKPLPPPDIVTPSPPAGPAGGAVAVPVPFPSPSPSSAAVTATPPAAFPAFPDRTVSSPAVQPVPDRDIRPQIGDASRSKSRTALGVRTVPVDTASQVRFSLPEPTGALVVGLVDDFPASRAGLPTGSVIVALDRQPVRSPMELTRLVNEAPIDRPVKLEYVLPGGSSGAAEVSLVSVPTAATGSPPQRSLADDPAVHDEIRQLRATLQSINRRIEELEQRTGGAR